MFYNTNPGAELRFGDVLKGFVDTVPSFKEPFEPLPIVKTEKEVVFGVEEPAFV
jgi:hypothetical protein